MYSLNENMPEDGHFIAVWTYNNKVWSQIFSMTDGIWYKYLPDLDDWERVENPMNHIPHQHESVTAVRFLKIDSDEFM